MVLTDRTSRNDLYALPSSEGSLMNKLSTCKEPNAQDVFHFDCSLVLADPQPEECLCSSISRPTRIGDQSLFHWVSEALCIFRQNHMCDQTGEWLFGSDKFRRWHRGDEIPLLWLHGSAGTGKSMLAAAAVKHLKVQQNPGDVVAYFFFDHRFRGSNSALNILSEIVSQLLSQAAPEVSRNHLQTILADLTAIDGPLSVSQLQFFISEIRHSLGNQTLILVLDGLDEVAKAQSQPDGILEELLEVMCSNGSRHHIKCFLSSRPDNLLHRRHVRSLMVNLDNEPSAQVDLGTFANDGLRKLQHLRGLEDISSWVEQLTSNRNRSFLRTGLILRFLYLENSSPAVVDHILTKSSTWDLFDVYSYMLTQISEQDRPSAQRILQWVLHTARPLQLEELHLVCPDMDITKSNLTRVSGGLLTTSKSKMVCLVHSSAKEYLLSLSGDWGKVLGDPNETMAHICMTSLPPIHLLQSLRIPIPQNSVQFASNLEQPVITSYAFHHWKGHYILAEPCSRYLAGLLHSYLQKAFQLGENEQRRKSLGILFEAVSIHITVANAALMASARFGFENLARLELQMGATAHLQNGKTKDSALHFAAIGGHLGVAQLLLQYDADPFALSSLGHTPLFYAAAFGRGEMMKLFLDHRLNGSGSIAPQPEHFFEQELTLTAIISASCTECCELHIRYIISRSSQTRGNEHLWTPIEIIGGAISQPSYPVWQTLSVHATTSSSLGTIEARTSFKWFAGEDMYNALRLCAKRGMSEIKPLLLAAENSRKWIDNITSIEYLVSEIISITS